MHDIIIENNVSADIGGLIVLELTDNYILQQLKENSRMSEFIFGNAALDSHSLMLYKEGVGVDYLTHTATVCVCDQCMVFLKVATVPKFALKNHLYHGYLPSEFSDITWVEEMAVAIYHSTAFITWLYFSDDPKNPHVFHGNTCAHEQNVLSTAKVLPWTANDLSGTISVLFVGPTKKIPKSILRNVFRIRKIKVLQFLQWLCANHRMYHDIQIDFSAVETYKDDDPLPGIEDRIIFDQTPNVKECINEECAAIDEPIASQLYTDSDVLVEQDSREDPTTHVMLEHTGIVDPDGASIPANSLIGSALCNLVSNSHGNLTPDILIYCGSSAINEYNNPSLFPGMFPTLFPFGIGSADDPRRSPTIKFQKFVEYLLDLDLPNFRYHRSFMFVALNIHQCHQSHLHTAFSVRKDRFEYVAQELSHLSPDIINSVAKHLESEGKITDLSDSQRKVLTLLKEVNTVSAKIPGSSASKIDVHNDI